jgi:hypothetical protein
MTFNPTIPIRPYNGFSPRATVIGYLEIAEPQEIEDSQEHAAWYRHVMIRPGSYPLFISSDRRNNFVTVRIPGEITRSYFGPRTLNKEAGEEYQISLQFNDYVIAQGRTLGVFRLLPEYAEVEKRIRNWRETADQSLDADYAA